MSYIDHSLTHTKAQPSEKDSGASHAASWRGALASVMRGKMLRVVAVVWLAQLAVFAGLSLVAPVMPIVAAGLFSAIASAIGVYWLAKDGAHMSATAADALTAVAAASSRRNGHLERAMPPESVQSFDDTLAHFRDIGADLTNRTMAQEQHFAELSAEVEQAQSDSKAKSRFVANMSHELRTPLNAILGYAMLLQEDAQEMQNDGAAADLERILKSGRHLSTLINDILDLSKIEAGKARVEHEIVNLHGLLEATVDRANTSLNANDNVIRWHVEEGLDVMVGDYDKMQKCLDHLVGNACKFTQHGKILIEASRDGDRFINLAVSDTGIGIDPTQASEMFEAFSQADSSISREYEGAGIGLALTKGICGLLGGEIEIESEKGIGTKVTMRLPVDSRPESEEPVQINGPMPIFEIDTEDRCALVIDDDDAAVELMRRWLERNNFTVLAANNGETGLELARQKKPDLILLDIMMPGRNGYDILRDIRGDTDISATPVILVTVDDDRTLALKVGANELLTKPVAAKRLEEVLSVYRDQMNGDVLVIEDDKDAGDLVQRCAEQIGFSIRRAYDGKDGLAQILERRPAAIVLDLMMPEMDGFQLIEALRQDPHLRDVPVVVLSAREISIEEHAFLTEAGYKFCAKASASPRDIAQNLKELVSK